MLPNNVSDKPESCRQIMHSHRESTNHNDKMQNDRTSLNKILIILRYFFISVVLLAIIYNVIHRLWEGVLLAVVTLVLFLLPSFFSKKNENKHSDHTPDNNSCIYFCLNLFR